MKYGAQCNYTGGCNDPSCDTCEHALAAFWVYIVAYSFANFMYFVMIQFGEGAVYLTILMTITTPFVALFFVFFNPSPDFHWDPDIKFTLAYRLVGLVIVVPALCFYHKFTESEIRDNRTLDIQAE